jgi:ribosomal protein S10
MKFNKTVTAIALTASSTAFGIIGPRPVPTKTICLPAYESDQGALFAGSCDETRNNRDLNRPLLENGCAADQIAVTAFKYSRKWNIEVQQCMSPNIVQL